MLVMGILNVTPDSFADGGKHFTTQDAVSRGKEMIAEGVDIIDVGGESTRPGADRITVEEELRRVIPVITELSKLKVTISIDTTRAEVAKRAIEAGASIVNDVSGGKADSEMFKTVSKLKCKYVLMHWRGHSKDMNSLANYDDVVVEVLAELNEQIKKALEAGVLKESLVIDPGLGFSKDIQHNWEILERISELVALGFPVLVGGSRKRFLGGDGPSSREEATINLTKSLVGKGIWGVRVHSVKPHKDVIGAN